MSAIWNRYLDIEIRGAYALGRDPIAIGKPKGTMLGCIRAK